MGHMINADPKLEKANRQNYRLPLSSTSEERPKRPLYQLNMTIQLKLHYAIAKDIKRLASVRRVRRTHISHLIYIYTKTHQFYNDAKKLLVNRIRLSPGVQRNSINCVVLCIPNVNHSASTCQADQVLNKISRVSNLAWENQDSHTS